MNVSADTALWRELFEAAYRRAPRKRLVAAALLAVVAHLLCVRLAPELELLAPERVPARPVELVEAAKVDLPEALLPEEFRKKKELRFVPVNPNAPERTSPAETPNRAAADQRAAQENPDPTTRSRRPENDGELEDSVAVAENVLPRELLPEELRTTRASAAPAEPVAATRSEDDASRDVPAENDSAEPDAPRGEAGVDARESDAGTLARGETPVAPPARRAAPAADADVPDPGARPRVAPPAGLRLLTMKSNTATNEIGAVSLDAKFSEFGDYTQRMLEAIQAAWYLACERSSVRARGTVVVRFTLCADGTLKGSEVVHSSAPELAAYACRDAVESRAPYEPWGAEMTEMFGEEQTTTISFHYR
ncbi:hypothetical protein [Candidatus Spyradosoma sp. SGI.093]|uniref:hypothetical protein n=1 Tax=Candidatus Spyradosoma sp. SGI.093 TaxID=3420583 RepID=UPI003CFFEFF9